MTDHFAEGTPVSRRKPLHPKKVTLLCGSMTCRRGSECRRKKCGKPNVDARVGMRIMCRRVRGLRIKGSSVVCWKWLSWQGRRLLISSFCSPLFCFLFLYFRFLFVGPSLVLSLLFPGSHRSLLTRRYSALSVHCCSSESLLLALGACAVRPSRRCHSPLLLAHRLDPSPPSPLTPP
jgi:hypothetical protein